MEICRIQEMSSITKDIIVQQYNREKNIILSYYSSLCSVKLWECVTETYLLYSSLKNNYKMQLWLLIKYWWYLNTMTLKCNMIHWLWVYIEVFGVCVCVWDLSPCVVQQVLELWLTEEVASQCRLQHHNVLNTECKEKVWDEDILI